MLVFPEGEFWQWVEVYANRTVAQFNEDGVSRHFHDIDQEKLVEFQMVHRYGKKVVIQKADKDNWRLIHFYRSGMTFSQNGKTTFRIPVAGYQVTRNGSNFKTLFFLYENGDVKVVYE